MSPWMDFKTPPLIALYGAVLADNICQMLFSLYWSGKYTGKCDITGMPVKVLKASPGRPPSSLA